MTNPQPSSTTSAVTARFNAAFGRVQELSRLAGSQSEAKQAETPKQLFLPGMEEFMRAMPNHVARSSLYAPIAKGKRTFHREALLVTRRDAVITYTGEQLDEADADLCMQLFFEAIPYPLGKPVTLNRAGLLTAMGRCTGKHDYEWLHRRMKALTSATLFIEAKKRDGSTKYHIGSTEAFHIVQGFRYDEVAGTYTFTLDPRWAVLFGNQEFGFLDWDKRLRLGQLAKSLQRLVSTSADTVQRYSLALLKERAQYRSPMRKFKEALTAAMRELEQLEIIAGGCIKHSTKGEEQAVWTKLPKEKSYDRNGLTADRE